ncbi:MAG: prolyl oligopeptidase family serine peptidase [Acidimicrobiia bacterium]|nr:prolyl oligopeptidase family serine peptidase [Acidimicrobiia bacterium]
MLTHSGIGLGEVATDGADLYWVESRPTEAGRSVIVRRTPDNAIQDVSPPGFNSRTRAHEYGGGAYAVRDGVVISSSFRDQRVYRLDGSEPRPITPEPDLPAGDRYADYAFHKDLIICVRERHLGDAEAVNELVVFPIDGSAPPRTIAGGHDFISSPCVSPDGTRLAWLTWDHPNMPWDGTDLWLAGIGPDGTLDDATRMAGGPEESIFQPEWSPNGALHFISDRTNWWNLYRLEGSGEVAALIPMEAEFGAPQWLFGFRRYAFLDSGAVVAVYERDGMSTFGVLDDGQLHTRKLDRNVIAPTLAVASGRVWTAAAGTAKPAAVVGIDPDSGDQQLIRNSLSIELEEAYFSLPQPIEFPTTGGAFAHAFYYPPANADFVAPEGELPPLVVWTHGGPTGSTSPAFALARQFWTSRGFALVDVNYRGSTGYGRVYRNALRGQWGVVDSDDCIAAARYLADQGLVDRRRMAIRGGSAGGYTALCALAFHDEFATGASYFGVADIGALAEETHKFESRYMDSLVGPYPEAAELYRERSPIYHTDQLSRPMVILQGLDDEVVPPDQAEMMIKALERKGIPYSYLAFEGEGHGFRKAENIERSAEAELFFYGWVFGFAPAGDIGPIEIRNA